MKKCEDNLNSLLSDVDWLLSEKIVKIQLHLNSQTLFFSRQASSEKFRAAVIQDTPYCPCKT